MEAPAEDTLVESAKRWLRQREMGLSGNPPETLSIEMQAVAFELISDEMLELEARQYLRRCKAAQDETASALENDIWICGDDSLSRFRLCSRLRAEVLRLESAAAKA